MSDEDFIRCPGCGNVNIVGTKECLFCGIELPETEEKEIETYICPNCETELPVSSKICPICGREEEREREAPISKDLPEGLPVPSKRQKAPSPAPTTVPSTRKSDTSLPTTDEEVPEISPSINELEVPVPSSKEKKMRLPEIPDDEKESEPIDISKVESEYKEIPVEKERSKRLDIRTKFYISFSILTLIISLLHYGTNILAFLTSFTSEPDLHFTLPITEQFGENFTLSGGIFFITIPITMFIAFIMSKFIRNREYLHEKTDKQNQWIITFILGNICWQVLFSLILIWIFDPADIPTTILLGAAFSFLIINIITIGFPFLLGTHILYDKLDLIYSIKEKTEANKVK